MAKVTVWGFPSHEIREAQKFWLAKKLGTASTLQQFKAIQEGENDDYEYMSYTDEAGNVIVGGSEGAVELLSEESKFVTAASTESEYFAGQLSESDES